VSRRSGGGVLALQQGWGALARAARLLVVVVLGLAGSACERPPATTPGGVPMPHGAVAAAVSPAPVPTSQPAAGAKAPAHRVFLWRAVVGASTLHLLGSVHVARSELYPLDARIESAFAGSDALVLELVLDEAAKLGAAQRMMELGRLEPGKKLRDVVQPKTWDLLLQTAKDRQLNLFGLHGFRPWFVALALTTQSLEAEGFSADQGIDEHFRRLATGHERILPLETIEEQLQLFAGLSPDAQELMLRQTLEEVDQYSDQLDEMFRAWSAGDAAALQALLVDPMRKEFPVLFDQLFTQRNLRMLAKLLDMMKQTPGRYFLVVGAGHLIGDGGLVDLLGRRGVTVEQL